MRLPQSIQLRIGHGLSMAAVTPNAGRVLFESAVAISATILTVALAIIFLSAALLHKDVLRAATVPVLFIARHTPLPLHSRLRILRARLRAVALFVSVAFTCASVSAFVDKVRTVLRAMMSAGPLVRARLLLSIHTRGHKAPVRIASTRSVQLQTANLRNQQRRVVAFLIASVKFGTTRHGVVAALRVARLVWKPLSKQPFFKSSIRHGLACAEDIFRKGIGLPSSSSATREDQVRVVNATRPVPRRALVASLSPGAAVAA